MNLFNINKLASPSNPGHDPSTTFTGGTTAYEPGKGNVYTPKPKDQPVDPSIQDPQMLQQVKKNKQKVENALRKEIYNGLDVLKDKLSGYGKQLGALKPEDQVTKELFDDIAGAVQFSTGFMHHMLAKSGEDRTSPGWHMATNYLQALGTFRPSTVPVQLAQSMMALWQNIIYAGSKASKEYREAYNFWQSTISGKGKARNPYINYNRQGATASATYTIFQTGSQS